MRQRESWAEAAVGVKTVLSALFVFLLIAASNAVASEPRGVDLRQGADVMIEGPSSQLSITAAGDVNGDGSPDILASTCTTARTTRFHTPQTGWVEPRDGMGSTYVIFGTKEAAEVDLSIGGSYEGFVIQGPEIEAYACTSRGVSDINGDGFDDVAIGAKSTDQSGRALAGSVYVVFGKEDESAVPLTLFDHGLQGDAGFRIDGPGSLALAGADLSGVGDVNGDGLDDLVVAAPWAAHSYVVFGKGDPTPVDLRSFHQLGSAQGYPIRHPSPDYSDGVSVAGGGDVNGDGVPDILIGYYVNDRDAGTVAVVFGKRSTSPLHVKRLGRAGFLIKGRLAGDQTGHSVANAGDVNGDGFDDVVIGAPKGGVYGARGHAYVVFGGRGSQSRSLGALAGGGFTLRGRHRLDRAGAAVAGAGDVNRDGLDDIVIGAPLTRIGSRGAETPYSSPGAAFVVYGTRAAHNMRLSALGGRGYMIMGAAGGAAHCEDDPMDCLGDWAGSSVAAAGDMNGDGYADVMVAAPFAADGTGRGYIVWSHPFLH